MALSPIAINISFQLWDEDTGTLALNFDFPAEVYALEKDGFSVLIFFYRSGQRSEDCLWGLDASLFNAIYEIDQPDGKSGRGGFEGTSYSNVYNG